MVGTRFGSYELTALLGRGGMGEVYRARDTKLNRDVAIKVLRDFLAADPHRLARFQREAQVLASLNHPNIASIYGVEEEAGVQALVLELVEGETLADRLKKAIPVVEALGYARQIAAALEAAHERGLVHRDLKPGNVMVKPDGTVKVLDFGLAKVPEVTAADDVSNSPTLTSQATQQGSILGTAAYMSPEQIKGKVVDKRADIWAFGVVLYEMLSGTRAFPGDETAEILAGIIKDEPRWDALPPDLPTPIRRLLRRCLSKDLGSRLRDIADARLEIEDALSPPHPEPVISPKTSRVFTVTRATLVAILLAALALVVIGAIIGVELPFSRYFQKSAGNVSQSGPLVIMMDSSTPSRVYDEETRAANGTNADVISDILADLPIQRQKELIGPEWHRDEEIRRFGPALIIIHFSGFNPEGDNGPRERLKILLSFFAETQTKFLIYSRSNEAALKANLSTLLADLYMKHPSLQQRVRAFGLNDYGPPRWVNTTSGLQLKLVVKEMLGIP